MDKPLTKKHRQRLAQLIHKVNDSTADTYEACDDVFSTEIARLTRLGCGVDAWALYHKLRGSV